MDLKQSLFWAVISVCYVQASDYWSHFADRLNQQMQQMSSEITNQINADFGYPNYPVHSQYENNFNNLGDRISANVRQQLKPLDNLGEKIQKQVEEGLQPVRALEMYTKMAKGIGGTTVILFGSPVNTKMIIRNGKNYICNDQEFNNLPTCSSTRPFTVRDNKDYCFSRSFSVINDKICVSGSPHGSLSVSVIFNDIKCSSSDNAPVLLTTEDSFKNMCGRLPWEIVYTYYPDPRDPNAIQIPNKNPYLTCDSTLNGSCTFNGSKIHGGSTIASSSSFIYSS